jgi:hypothetical protein
MMLQDACQLLGIYDIALQYASVWSMTGCDSAPLDKLLSIAKTNFKQLALKYHPDTGGTSEKFQELNDANIIINCSKISDFILLLRTAEKKYTPGDINCKTCAKWNNLAHICMTVECSGYKQMPGTN